MLYIVPTPIGNLSDITWRAVDVLNKVDSILCEDTRTSSKLLKHLEISKPLKSYHAYNEHKTVSEIISELALGKSIAIISDAGTPSISDPGFLLVRACIEHDIKVTCLPGPTALIPALVMSGMPSDTFYYAGFLPHKKGRQLKWKYLSQMPCTIILYESPYRLVKCLEEISQYCGADRRVCVVREISKIYEEAIHGTALEVLNVYKEKTIKGEFVIVLHGASQQPFQ